MKFSILSFFYLASLFLTNCTPKNENNPNLTKPKVFILDNILNEISGLSFYDGAIYTHNDENGILLKINPMSGDILDYIKFGEDADYEGIEIVNDKAYIIKSNGTISEYNLATKKLDLFSNQLKIHNNVEGLTYNKKTNELLIACKGAPIDTSKNKKAIYSYSLTNNKLNNKPYLEIKINDLNKYLDENYPEISDKKFKHLMKRVGKFSPSGIAIHPKTQELYIVSAKGSTLIIFNQNKKLQHVIFLDKNDLPQAEGICFDNELNLYISTEANNSKAKILKYSL